ncbi:cysteine desulfurase [Streptomyces sp. SID13666]|uniref:cysteine desulfurase family protein n=1 Tax=Streptomyces TaxID=1883 RepID=UPI0011068B92|nr:MULTISPECIES: cysteine desulfurase family protein [Streptomyces]MCZ4098381.1 cysteine desulfurase family protein [Streptomyces sp. H39-C1]NEA57894.1 cysteine desulfurase [Streptomyces sp. SID13666]NEA74956.1 cysteine desulfurase [Streptomyces sp. SID13588]QNA75508.1 cysteine desulfurase [Streptomyces sp. So13.3]
MAYLDHAATTPMLPEAVRTMTAHLTVTGNASSLHAPGRRARRTVEESRESLAEALGARPSEIVFTGGGTESDNLAVKGLYWARRAEDPRRVRVLASPVEHHAVLDAVDWLVEHEGARVEWLPVDAYGRVHPDALREAIERDPGTVALATVMWANNEVGTIMPVRELAAVAREHGVPLHADAVQAFGQVEVDFAASGLDAMTVTGHKIGGPYGVGALVLRREHTPVPLLHGGGQERSRSGTLDVPAIAAFATAGTLAAERREQFAREVGALRDELVAKVLAAVPEAVLNGDPAPEGRLPANAHFTFPGCEGDSLLLLLDAQGIACSTGSACTAGVAQPSHVLIAMGQPADRARGSLRFSLGHTTTQPEIDALAAAIGPVVERARKAGLS